MGNGDVLLLFIGELVWVVVVFVTEVDAIEQFFRLFDRACF